MKDDRAISLKAALSAADSIIERDTSGNNDVVKAMTAWKEYIKALPSAQPTGTNTVQVDDCISRQAALDAMETWDKFGCDPDGKLVRYDDDKHYIPYVHYEDMVHAIKQLSPTQPEIMRCKDCRYNNDCEIQYSAQSGDEFFCGCAERKDNG